MVSCSEGTQFPTSAWAPHDFKSFAASFSARLYHGADIALDNSLIQDYESGLGIQNDVATSDYTGQALVLGSDIQNYQLQGNYNSGFAQGHQDYGTGGDDFNAGYQHQLDFSENQALTTGFNPHAQLQDARAITHGFNPDERSFSPSPALHGPASNSPVYANQAFTDATFTVPNVTGPIFYDPTDSSVAFSGPGQTFSPPAFPGPGPASIFSDQNLSMSQYAAYQDTQLPVPNAYSSPIPHGPVVAATPAQTMQPALPITQQSLQCMQPNCDAVFTRDADRIRHERARHGANHGLHLCPIPGCPKAQGRGYSRADKVTEHLWKKHGNLGFVKRV